MKNTFKLNGDIEITMTPQSQNWKQVMELVKDGDVFTVTKNNNSPDVVFKRTGQSTGENQIGTRQMINSEKFPKASPIVE